MSIHRRVSVLVTLAASWAIVTTMFDGWDDVARVWFIAPTMAIGSLIAGASAEGGGAVAFPVLTLIFGVEPGVARDFSLAIQSVGMSAAAITIVRLKLIVEWRAVVIGIAAGLPGLMLGVDVIGPAMSAASVKMFFVSFWMAFGVLMIFVGRSKWPVVDRLKGLDSRALVVMALASFIGGCVTGLTGSGLDIAVFSVAVLGLRLSEIVATRTSIVLMAITSVAGLAYRSATGGLTDEAWSLWLAAWPIVIIGAPTGAWLMRGRSRAFVVRLLCSILVVQFFSAVLILQLDEELIVTGVVAFVIGLITFIGVASGLTPAHRYRSAIDEATRLAPNPQADSASPVPQTTSSFSTPSPHAREKTDSHTVRS